MIPQARAVEMCYLIPGWMWPSELNTIYDLCRGVKRHVEIGSFCGRSLLASACALAQGASLLSIDPLVGNALHCPSDVWAQDVFKATVAAIASYRPDIKFEHRQAWTPDALRTLPIADGIFIDSTHHYAETLAEIEACYERVDAGGFVGGHDYWPAIPSVPEAVNEFFGTRNLSFEVIPGTRIWWHRKR